MLSRDYSLSAVLESFTWIVITRLLSWDCSPEIDCSPGSLSWNALLECSPGMLSRLALLDCPPGLLSMFCSQSKLKSLLGVSRRGHIFIPQTMLDLRGSHVHLASSRDLANLASGATVAPWLVGRSVGRSLGCSSGWLSLFALLGLLSWDFSPGNALLDWPLG